MGNCLTKKKNKKQCSGITPSFSPPQQPPEEATLHGDSTTISTNYLRFALTYKPLTLRFIHSETPTLLLQISSNSDDQLISGSHETILRNVELKLPHPPLLLNNKVNEITMTRMVELQHRSLTWHIDRVARWILDIATRGGMETVDRSNINKVGTVRMEVNKVGKSYGHLLDILVEHAQFEERSLFPLLHSHHPGVCRRVNEEHARDLPIMNGIKEDMKSIGVMNTGSPTHREALLSLSARLKTLQNNCGDHFDEEEKNLFPLMEATELTWEQQRKTVEQCIDIMHATHSHLFRFFIEGLLPHEAIEYLDLIMTCVNKEKVSSMLHLLVELSALCYFDTHFSSCRVSARHSFRHGRPKMIKGVKREVQSHTIS